MTRGSGGPELLVDAATLKRLLTAGETVVMDCRFDLARPRAGREAWQEGHIPGAAYAHLDDDLSAPVTAQSGRHPLPAPAAFAAFLARSGWKPGRRIVAYDDQGNAIAARLWWLMRYFGHDCASLLDGGLASWVGAGLALERGPVDIPPADAIELTPDHGMVVESGELRQAIVAGTLCLLDARAKDRFAGRNETLDTVAGHVPGARSAPYSANLDADGAFRSAQALRRRFEELLGDDVGAAVAHMCGSGVTACHNLISMELAGFDGGRLYAGSWSEWIRDPGRPVARGAD